MVVVLLLMCEMQISQTGIDGWEISHCSLGMLVTSAGHEGQVEKFWHFVPKNELRNAQRYIS